MQTGQKIGPFEIEMQLGSGAMGAVYRAKYRKTGKRVALKFMLAGMGGNETALARFEREWEVLKQLNHRNIVQFYIHHQHQGAPYYAMEYIEGEPLDQVLKRRGRLTWEEVVDFGKQICAALQHAHDQGIVHRDLKPSNLMITPDGTLKLTDFGIAKDLDVTQLTGANCTVGTAAYMSPEQCRGERNLSHRSDLYSLGIVLYELLTGEKPFKCETTMDMFLAHVQGTFERPSRVVLDIPVWLDTLVCQLLEKEPTRRPFDAALVAQALEKVAEKVAAQRSAGIDRAHTRVADRGPARSAGLDETDKRAARTLRAATRKGTRKRKTKRFYERAWLQAAGILILLAGIGGILYEKFRPPDAELLFQATRKQAEAAKNPEERLAARNGAIKDYLYYYGKRDDERTHQVKRWADAIDVEQKWLGLPRRRKVAMAPENDAEAKAREAIDREEAGRLADARESWQTVEKLAQPDPDPDVQVYALLAQKRLRALEGVDGHEQDLLRRIGAARSLGQEFKPEGEPEQLAGEALRFEDLQDFAGARNRWAELRGKYEKDLEQGAWGLLAVRKVVDVKSKILPEMEETRYRAEALKRALARAEQYTAEGSFAGLALCRDISTLYDKETDREIAAQVAIARKRLEAPGGDSRQK